MEFDFTFLVLFYLFQGMLKVIDKAFLLIGKLLHFLYPQVFDELHKKSHLAVRYVDYNTCHNRLYTCFQHNYKNTKFIANFNFNSNFP